MDNIDKAILTLNRSADISPDVTLKVDARCQIVMTLCYLGLMLSVPLDNLEQLVWFAVYPILWSTLSGYSYSMVFRRSLIVLPFIIFIGIFNPFFDHTPEFSCFGIEITRGWVTFLSIIVRGLLSVQAVIILITNTGFIPMCRALGRLGMPTFMETQLMLVYRYLTVLLEELQTMRRARAARGAAGKLTLRLWGTMIGQLFVRTVNRAERIQRAMVARGFNGKISFARQQRGLRFADIAIAIAWIAAFVILRIVNIPSLLHLQ